MPLFGLIWASSWIGYFLTSSQGLLKVPDRVASAFPTQVFSVVSSPIEIPTPLFSTPLYSGAGSSNASVAVLPNLAFQISASGSSWRSRTTQTPTRPTNTINAVKNVFCPPELKPEKNSLPVVPPLQSSSGSGKKTASRDGSKATFPQQILQVMKTLLPRQQRVEAVEQPLVSSVRVVSTRSLEEVEDKQKSEGKRVKRGFWQYSQVLARRVFAAPTSIEEERFQVWVKDHLVAQFPNQQHANLMAQRLKQFFSDPSDPYLNASPIEPALFEGVPAVKVGDRLLFKVDDTLAKDLNRNGQLLAIEWANNLRVALGKIPLKLVEAQRRMYNLVETPKTFKGRASWYGPKFDGRITATGETYSQHELTAAHPSLPFNTYLKVRNLKNGDSVIVRINDRGPYIPDRSLDLSREAARCINGEKAGIVRFEAVVMRSPLAEIEPARHLVRN